MGRGETCLVGKSQRDLIGQAEMQRFVGIEEDSMGGPKAGKKAEQRN